MFGKRDRIDVPLIESLCTLDLSSLLSFADGIFYDIDPFGVCLLFYLNF